MLPYGRQFVDEADIGEVVRVLNSDYLTTGPEIDDLEAAMCATTGAAHAVACANGTAALHILSMAMGLGPDDQVIVPTISFVATANGPRYCGAQIVFADVDGATGNMTPATLRDALSRADPSKVKAIFVVHMGGHPADVPAMRAIADEVGAFLVEDACHALGGSYEADGDSHPVGACHHSDFATLSLHPVKTITCGEGGVVLTPHADHAEAMRLHRSHGLLRDPERWVNDDLGFDGSRDAPNPWYYELQEIGYNYRLTDFQAAMARSQLAKLDEFARQRRMLCEAYQERAGELPQSIGLVQPRRGTDPVQHLMVALIDFEGLGRSRREVMAALRESGVGSQVHYVPIHLQPYYREASATPDLPGARAYYDACLSLPLYPGMEIGDVETVIAALKGLARS